NKPEETALVLDSDGWLRTGDIAMRDEEGYFFIVDRKKDMIDVSGFKVYPRDVEEVLFRYPGVQEAVVGGVPDAYRGETVKAYLVMRPGQSAGSEQIIEFCREHLAKFKVPSEVEFRTELPKTIIGKALRRVLRSEEEQKAVSQDIKD